MSDNLMESLFLTGKVVKLNCSIWSGQKKLRPEELGFGNGDLNRKLINLGSKWMIPKEEITALNNIRSEAKREIESSSLKFSFGRFIPNEKMESLRQKLTELRNSFQDRVMDVASRYPELRQQMLDEWNEEAVTIASRKGDPNFVFEVMNRIEQALPDWNRVQNKFSFGWSEYSDMNRMARDFIEESTKGVLDKMVEFAESLKAKLSENKLSDRNLAPVRKYIEAMRDSIQVFRNDRLTAMLNDLDAWVMEGTGEESKASKQIRHAMSSAMDNLITAGREQADEIARASIEAMTSYEGRKLEMDD